jgi:hypothetical protein
LGSRITSLLLLCGFRALPLARELLLDANPPPFPIVMDDEDEDRCEPGCCW